MGDLLNALNEGQNGVLGSLYSRWRTRPREGIDLVLEHTRPVEETTDLWEWMRDPLPPPEEGVDFQLLRRRLKIDPSGRWASPEVFHELRKPDLQRIKRLFRDFFPKHNPFIRHIVRRTRDYLENTIDPQTNEPYLQRIEVRLFGESEAEAIALPAFLGDAYNAAEEFCNILASRPVLNSGFMKTILLRRAGSTIEAGRLTAMKMLGAQHQGDQADEEGENEEEEKLSSIYPLSHEEREGLGRFLRILEENRDEDPKLRQLERILTTNETVAGGWLSLGCIIFSQFYDSVLWLGRQLSGRMPDEKIAVYAGAAKSGIIEKSEFHRLNRDEIKRRITTGELRLVIGTEAASEGLNLQRLGSLINLDLPWKGLKLNSKDLDQELLVLKVPDFTRTFGFGGDKIVPGISIGNSEVGCLSFVIEAYFYRLICSNGLIAKTAVASRFRHVSRKALEEFPGLLRQVVYESEHNQRRFEISTQNRLDNPLSTIGSFNRQFLLTKREAEAVTHAWEIEQGFTMFYVIGAYTRAAHQADLTTEEEYRLERIGGIILSMVKS